MIRNLLIISGAGLFLAIVGIGGSLAVGGADLARHSFTWAIDDQDGGLNIRRMVDANIDGERVERLIPLEDSERLAINLPGEVLYIQTSEAPGITLSGTQALVNSVTYTNGQLLLSENIVISKSYVTFGASGLRGWNELEGLKVTIRSPNLKAFELSGSSDLKIQAYDQPNLDLLLTGNADIEVQGRTERLSVDASGHGEAELDELITRDASLKLSGNAGVRTAANGLVVIDSSGSSRVRLTRRPSELRQSLTGEAEVRQD